MHQSDHNYNYIKIQSDSQAAIQALNNPRINSKSVLNAIESLETLASITNFLTLASIKAHVGTEGNEQADQAAREGAARGKNKLLVKTPIPWQVAKTKIEARKTHI